MDACVVLVTCGSEADAARIAEAVVAERLAACVNVISPGAPVQSFYMWEGALQKEPEHLLVIKTLMARLPELEARIKALHPYTVPEFIALPIVGGSKDYLDWLRENTQ